MHSVSAFFTAYSALRAGAPVEVIAAVVSDGPGVEPILRFVVVDGLGHASVAASEELNLYGVVDAAANDAEAIAATRKARRETEST